MKRTAATLVLAIVGGSCASAREARLEARVAVLERQLAEQRAASSASSGRCAHVDDDSVPPATRFAYDIPFDTGHSSLRDGDRIVITEVHGTKPDFAEGGMYLVRGTYNLASADE